MTLHFLDIFEGYADLSSVRSEKGDTSDKSKNTFDDDSEFCFVEKTFKENYDYFICDDLGMEYADHIGITKERHQVSFFLSKLLKSNSAQGNAKIVSQILWILNSLIAQCYEQHINVHIICKK